MTEEEFKIEVIPFTRKLYPMMKFILKDQEEARDALQEMMYKLWRSRNELAKWKNPQAYIVTMAKNYCYDLLKKKKPSRIEDNVSGSFLHLEDGISDHELKEKYEQVRLIIDSLPEKHRQVIRLRDVDGFEFEEIKVLTGLEISNIRVILSRARQKVKEELKKIYDYEDKRQTAGKIL